MHVKWAKINNLYIIYILILALAHNFVNRVSHVHLYISLPLLAMIGIGQSTPIKFHSKT